MSGHAAAVPNVYLGTSEFAAAVLRALAESPHRPSLVVTPPDRPRGRGRKLASPPAALTARELEIPLHQTASVNDPGSAAAIAETGAEVGCVCAFGQLIGSSLLARLPMLNVHPSLLPRWRGAAPIERAIMAGDARTGCCVMRLTEGLDEGPVARREELGIGPDDDYGSVAGRLALLGGEMLVEAFNDWASGGLEFSEQEAEGVTYAEKIEASERRVDPSRPAGEEARRIRALTPHVGAYAELAGGERLGVRGPLSVEGELASGRFGEGEGLRLGFADGVLEFAEVQPAGGRWMSSADYLRGRGVPA